MTGRATFSRTAAVLALTLVGSLVSTAPATAAQPAVVEKVVTSVTCPSATTCWATELRRLNGRPFEADMLGLTHGRWTKVSIPEPSAMARTAGATSSLYGLSCRSTADCWAVGSWGTASLGTVHDYLVHWDGRGWTAYSAGPVGGAGSLGLYSVACVSAHRCWALGSYTVRGRPLAEALQWDGLRWSTVRLAGVTGSPHAYWDISCADSACWTAAVPGQDDNYLLHYSDGHWHRAPGGVGGIANDFGYVSCGSASSCWTVRVLQGSVVQHWDGQAWTANGLPTQATTPDQVTQLFAQSVTCVSADDCWAVGDDNTGEPLPQTTTTAGTRLTAWHWDGSQWSAGFVRAAAVPFGGELTGVACTSTSSCWAVGYYTDQSALSHSVLAHWNGRAWSS